VTVAVGAPHNHHLSVPMRVSILGQASVHARFFRVYGILFWGSWGRFCGWKRTAKAPGCSPRPVAHFPSLPRAIGPLFVQLATTLDKNSYPLLAQPLADKANPKAKMQSKIHDPVVSGQSTKNKRERQSEKMMTDGCGAWSLVHCRRVSAERLPARRLILCFQHSQSRSPCVMPAGVEGMGRG
jgi:hypothetical protein